MTAKYPVDLGDEEGILDAVNYLLIWVMTKAS